MFLNVCFVSGMVLIEWRNACIVLLYNGIENKNECPILKLLCVVGKLYGSVLIKRIRDSTDGAIGEVQCGFRSGRGCANKKKMQQEKSVSLSTCVAIIKQTKILTSIWQILLATSHCRLFQCEMYGKPNVL